MSPLGTTGKNQSPPGGQRSIIITANDKRVLETIGQLLDENVTPITYPVIQERSAVSVRTIVRAVDRLTVMGYLAVNRAKKGLPYTYTILKQPDNSNNGA